MVAAAPTESEGFLPARDNLRLFWREVRPALEPGERVRAEVALVHGYGDHGGRYSELMRALAARGFAVHAVDYRGHGQADGRRGHVDRFAEYLDDLDVFLARVAERAEGRRLFLVGHSQGGLLVLLREIERPTAGVAGVALSNPYLKLNFAPPAYLVAVSGLLSRLLPWLPVGNALQPAMLTRDPAIQAQTNADLLYNRNATPRWFTESNLAKQEVARRAAEFKLPLLLLLGSDDPVASPGFSREVFARLGSADKTEITYPEMRHEVFNELGRAQVFADLAAWLEARS